MTRFIAIVLVSLFCSLVASHVQADTRVSVLEFYGPNADRLRDDVVNLLERQSNVTIIPKGQIESSAMKLGVDPFSPGGRMALARELQLSAWMTGVVKKRGGKLKLTVAVFDGAQHSIVGRASLRGRNVSRLSDEIRARLWRKSRRAILRAAAPGVAAAPEAPVQLAAPAPDSEVVITESEIERASVTAEAVAARDEAPAAEQPPEITPITSRRVDSVVLASAESAERDQSSLEAEDRSRRRAGRGESLRASIAFGSPYRSLAYSDPISASLGDYRLSGAPMVDVNIAFHPARPFTDSWVSFIGVDMRAQIAGNMPSFDRDGNRFTSSYGAYHVGLRGRMPVGEHYVSAFSGYAISRFAISPQTKGVTSQTPSVDYRTIRSGLGAELALSNSLVLGFDAAWLQSLSAGQIAEWFPRSTVGGLEALLFATYDLTQVIFARAAITYQRTYFDFNAKPDDEIVAGGATDQYLATSVGVGVNL